MIEWLLAELENKLHYFMEECNQLQGVQLFCDVDDGFLGLTTKLIESFKDDYGSKKSMTLFGFSNNTSNTRLDVCYILPNPNPNPNPNLTLIIGIFRRSPNYKSSNGNGFY